MFTLPEEMKLALAYLITNGIKSVINLLGKDISGWTAAIVAAFAWSVLHFGEAVLTLVDPPVQQTVLAILSAILSILGLFGIHRTGKILAGQT